MANSRNLTGILLELHRSGRNGVLRFERIKAKKQLVMLNGRLEFAESNQPEEHLAKVMVRQGSLSKSAIREIAVLMKEGKTSEEAILSLSGVDAAKVASGRREQAVAIMSSLWTWPDYDMHFYEGNNLVRKQESLSLPLPEVLLASARRAVSERLISAPPDFHDGAYSPVKGMAPMERELPLTGSESAVLSLLRDTRKTTDLLSSLPTKAPGSPEPSPEASLLCLSLLGLIRFCRPSEFSAGEVTDPAFAAEALKEMLLRFETATFYEILQVPSNASQEQIQTSYYELARKYHPDRFQSKNHVPEAQAAAQKVFVSINEAYLLLKDPAARARYDAQGSVREVKKAETEVVDDAKAAESLFQAGRIHLAQKEYEKAVERLKGCVWLRPEKAAYQHYLGVAEARVPGMGKSAEQHLLKAIELDTFSIDSRLELARLYLSAAMRLKAETQIEAVMGWDPENRDALRLKAALAKLP